MVFRYHFTTFFVYDQLKGMRGALPKGIEDLAQNASLQPAEEFSKQDQAGQHQPKETAVGLDFTRWVVVSHNLYLLLKQVNNRLLKR